MLALVLAQVQARTLDLVFMYSFRNELYDCRSSRLSVSVETTLEKCMTMC